MFASQHKNVILKDCVIDLRIYMHTDWPTPIGPKLNASLIGFNQTHIQVFTTLLNAFNHHNAILGKESILNEPTTLLRQMDYI